MQDELLLNLSGHIVALINVVLDAGRKTGDKDEILERLDTINILIGEIRNAANNAETPAIPQQPQAGSEASPKPCLFDDCEVECIIYAGEVKQFRLCGERCVKLPVKEKICSM